MQPVLAGQKGAGDSRNLNYFVGLILNRLAWGRLEVQLDSLADILQRLLTGFALRPAAFQGRTMRDVLSILSKFNDHLDVHTESVRMSQKNVNRPRVKPAGARVRPGPFLLSSRSGHTDVMSPQQFGMVSTISAVVFYCNHYLIAPSGLHDPPCVIGPPKLSIVHQYPPEHTVTLAAPPPPERAPRLSFAAFWQAAYLFVSFLWSPHGSFPGPAPAGAAGVSMRLSNVWLFEPLTVVPA